MRARFLRAWPPLVSAILLLAAFPPLNLSLLAFLALAPWLVSLREASGWGAFRSGYLFGFVYQLGQLAWIYPLVDRWTNNAALALAPWLIGSALTATFFALFAALARQCWLMNAPWLIALVWAGVEVIRSYIPLFAFPWGLAATPLWQFTPIIQAAHFGTIYLVSSWVALMSVILAQFLKGDGFIRLRIPILVWISLLGLSLVRYSEPISGTKKVVTVGQLGVNLAFRETGYMASIGRAMETLFDAALVQGSALLVLPEGTVTGANGASPSLPFPYPQGLPFILGGQRRGDGSLYQSAFAYDGKWQYADKTRLVIFGEYVPGRSWIPLLSSFNLPGGDLTAGEEVKALQIGSIKVGPVLCFEGLFHDISHRQALNGAQLLAVLSIDDWYMGTPAPKQLEAAAVFRAIETGLPLARAASTGYSLAVDQRGNVLAEAPVGKTMPLRVELMIPERADLFPAVNAFPALAAAACVGVPLAAMWSSRRKAA